MYVSYKDVESYTREITYGVPQGSVLGPLLFVLYINDLPNCLNVAKAILYADDNTLYIGGKSNEILFQLMNNELIELSKWFKTNKLHINISKTKYMLFRSKTKKFDDKFALNIDNRMIDRCVSFDLLGVVFDELLTWNEHIKQLHVKLSYCVYSLNKVKSFLDKDNLKRLYYSLFQSYLDYGILLWSNTTLKNIKIIQKLQKKAIRIINKTSYNAHTANLFINDNILTIEKYIDKQLYTFMYRYIHNLLPPTICTCLQPNSEIHEHNTRQRNNPHLIKSKKQIYLNSFLHKATIKWQALPTYIKTKTSKNSFTKSIKQYLIKA